MTNIPENREEAILLFHALAAHLGYTIHVQSPPTGSIPITPEILNKIWDAHSHTKSKIHLVKYLRDETKCELRVSKEAIERFMVEKIGAPFFTPEVPIPIIAIYSEIEFVLPYATAYPDPRKSLEQRTAQFLSAKTGRSIQSSAYHVRAYFKKRKTS